MNFATVVLISLGCIAVAQGLCTNHTTTLPGSTTTVTTCGVDEGALSKVLGAPSPDQTDADETLAAKCTATANADANNPFSMPCSKSADSACMTASYTMKQADQSVTISMCVPKSMAGMISAQQEFITNCPELAMKDDLTADFYNQQSADCKKLWVSVHGGDFAAVSASEAYAANVTAICSSTSSTTCAAKDTAAMALDPPPKLAFSGVGSTLPGIVAAVVALIGMLML